MSIIVNTSFNVRGEPIVCSIEDLLNVLWVQTWIF